MPVTNHKHEFYYLSATADNTQKPGETIEICWGMIRGMTDDGQPGWTASGYGGPIQFNDLVEAMATSDHFKKGGMYGYNFEKGRDVRIHFKTVETTVITIDEVIG